MKKNFIGDIISCCIIFLGVFIPYQLKNLFVYIDNKQPFYIVQFTLTCIFLFIFFIYVAYIIHNFFNGKYK